MEDSRCPGQLFTQYFLTDGIRETREWSETAGDFDIFRQNLAWHWESFKAYHEPNESTTEQDFIVRRWMLWAGWITCLNKAPGATRIFRPSSVFCLRA